MTLRTKILAASFGALTMMAATSAALAQVTPDTCSILDTVSDLFPLGSPPPAGTVPVSCDFGDKRFTFLDFGGLLPNVGVEFSPIGDLVLSIGADAGVGGILGPTTGFIEFTILVTNSAFVI